MVLEQRSRQEVVGSMRVCVFADGACGHSQSSRRWFRIVRFVSRAMASRGGVGWLGAFWRRRLAILAVSLEVDPGMEVVLRMEWLSGTVESMDVAGDDR